MGLSSTRKQCLSTSSSTRWVYQVQENSARVHLPVPGGSVKNRKTVPEYIFQYQVDLSSTRKQCPSASSSTRWVYQVQENSARVHLPVPGGSIKYKKTVPEYIFQYQVGLSRTGKQCPSTSSSTRWVCQIHENSSRVHLPVPGGLYQILVPDKRLRPQETRFNASVLFCFSYLFVFFFQVKKNIFGIEGRY